MTDWSSAHRVLEHDEPRAAGRSRASRSRSQRLGVGEAPADDLEQPAADEHVLGAPAQALLRGVRRPGARRGGQRRRELVDAVDARDLLDQVGLARDVVARGSAAP